LLLDVESQSSEEELPEKEILAEEIAVWYFSLVMKALISDLSNYSAYDPSFFSDLTSE
jgi:hypothetical protein